MLSSPLISIVMPVYNASHYIDEAIQSILSQTYQNWELILVDDGSIDDTLARIASYEKNNKQIHIIRHDTNRRLPAALNTGFSLAKGDYFTWTSDDNLYYPDALEEMVTFLESNPDVDVVYTDMAIIDELGECVAFEVAGNPEMLIVVNVVGACFLYRRIVHEVLEGYNEDLFLAEDLDFFLRAMSAFKLQPLHKTLYSYRLHKNSLTSTQSSDVYRVHENAIKPVISQIDIDKDTKSLAYVRLAKRALRHRHFVAVMKYGFIAIRYSPTFIIKTAIKKLLKP